LSQIIDTPIGGGAILDHVVTNASELIDDMKTGGSLGYSDHALVEFTLLRDTRKSRSVFRMMNTRKASFQLFKQLVRKSLWEMVLRDR